MKLGQDMELRPGIYLILGTLVLGRTILYIEQGLCAREVYTVKTMGDSQTVVTQNSEMWENQDPCLQAPVQALTLFPAFLGLDRKKDSHPGISLVRDGDVTGLTDALCRLTMPSWVTPFSLSGLG